MKNFLTYLLSLGILLLACISCEDATSSSSGDQFSVSTSKIAKTENANHTDNCSPLCICSCCGQPMVNDLSSQELPAQKNEETPIKQVIYNKQFISQYTQNIWQPPKLNKSFIG